MCFDLNGKPLEFYDTRTFASQLNLPNWQSKPFLTDKQIMNGEIDFRDPRTHDEVLSDSAHLNSIAVMQNGDLLVSCGLIKTLNHIRLLHFKNWLVKNGAWEIWREFNRFLRRNFFKKKMKNRHNADLVIQPAKGCSSVARITKDRVVQPCLLYRNATAPAHSLRLLSDGTAIYLKTTSGEIVHFKPESGEVISTTVVAESFLRGACELPDGTLLLGDGNKIINFDLQRRKILSVIQISDDPHEVIFDLLVLPDHFSLPPESFVSHHAKYLPVTQI
jgi:hypothetical protein